MSEICGKSRKIPRRMLSAILIIAAVTVSAFCETYYVDAAEGNDNHPGTKDLPFKTIGKAQAAATGGDTVILADGQYGDFSAIPQTKYSRTTDKFEPNDPRWITFKAADGVVPQISHVLFAQEEKGPALLSYKLCGIKVLGGGVVLRGIVGIQMQNCEIAGNGGDIEEAKGGYVSIRSCGSVYLEKCKIHYTRKTCISISSSSYVTISDSEIYDVGGDHITLRTEFDDCNNVNILNNIIRDSRRWNPESHNDGIQFYAAEGHRFYNCRITGNVIRDMAVQGLFIHAGKGRFVSGLMENNLIYRCKGVAVNIADTDNTIFRHNTVIGYCGISSDNSGLAVYNNLIGGPYRTNNPAALGYHDFNIYVKDWKNWLKNSESHSFAYPKDYKAKMTNQLFVNAHEDDYRLKAGCKAIDFCPKEPAATTDITGRARDDKPDGGCYEFIPEAGPTDPNNS